ncbi:hypothetical protein [Ulvibacter litoralis]|uniref:Uncharacterized protein n=1 Tax=Ulvibacter litoralis TaxID=227084 RepID=A0A1G7GB34_9FLAO|nr:hypothetical protein [Ulvibacter litoralis]GHC56995.1 hypothetical protein GCM10008083_22020 [Ulvibacter litoralis]SDE85321.1 hypothetical protein SAMN05421855_10318 [Ulvibacter litoralis]
MESTQAIEKLFKETFGNVYLFYRDTTLDPSLIAKYKPSQIIMERGFTDMASFANGLSDNCRYTIVSASAKSLPQFNPELHAIGAAILPAGSYFKVLDVYTIGTQTQITLLQFPKYGLNFLKVNQFNAEKKMKSQLRIQFEQKLKEPILKEGASTDWKKRTSAPLGMSDDGVFFLN